MMPRLVHAGKVYIPSYPQGRLTILFILGVVSVESCTLTWTHPAGTSKIVYFLRSIILQYACTPRATRSYLTAVCVLFRFCFFLFFVSLEMSFVPSIFCTITVFYLHVEYVLFYFQILFFYLVTTGWIFYISLCEDSINQSKSSIQQYKAFCLSKCCTVREQGTWVQVLPKYSRASFMIVFQFQGGHIIGHLAIGLFAVLRALGGISVTHVAFSAAGVSRQLNRGGFNQVQTR